VDDPEILRFATELIGPTPIETAENILNWIADHVYYTGDLGDPHGALFALQNRLGDSTDIMYLFAALCRANMIPARCIGGYVIGRDGALNEEDYHNWVEIYVDGVWRIADPQRRVLMKNASQYIAIQVIGRSPERQKDDLDQFRFVGNRLKVKMNG
jgi:transglutaminase-like putative cysteine protease